MITVHYAQTLDGRIATRSGESQWIGGPESLRLAHQLRATHEAVLVGVGTVIQDNPRLTTRLVEGRSPLRIVADSTLRLPLGANVLTDGAAPTLVVTTDRASMARQEAVHGAGVEIVVVDADAAGFVDLRALLSLLGRRGIGSLLVEGGAAIISSMLRTRLCDRLVVCIAPRLLGQGTDAVGDLGIDRLKDALSFSTASFSQCGEDMIFDGHFAGIASVAG